MTRIIGHRGAAGLAFENSGESIKAALKESLDGIEFDLRRTADGQLIVHHNPCTSRKTGRILKIKNTTLKEIRKLRLPNGQQIPTLEEALKIVDSKTLVVIDIKGSGVTDELLRVLGKLPKMNLMFTGRVYSELAKLHKARPDIPFLVQHHFDPLEIIHTAKSMDATGISLNMWLMNPLTYRLATEAGLEMFVYTVNHRWIMNMYKHLYPDAAIFTNYPNRFMPPKQRRAAKKLQRKSGL